jgi:hypothetical protein
MQSKLNLLGSSVLRGVQMLFGIVVLGLSVTLIRDHNRAPTQSGWETYTFPKAPIILSLVAAIGGVSFAAAVFSLVVAWTNLLREYIEMVVDIIVIIANVVGGTVCHPSSQRSRVELTDMLIDYYHQITWQELRRYE